MPAPADRPAAAGRPGQADKQAAEQEPAPAETRTAAGKPVQADKLAERHTQAAVQTMPAAPRYPARPKPPDRQYYARSTEDRRGQNRRGAPRWLRRTEHHRRSPDALR